MTPRIVPPAEAQALREAATQGPWEADEFGKAVVSLSEWVADVEGANSDDLTLIAAAPDLAYTVQVQGEQIAAVLALHTGKHHCRSLIGGNRLMTFGDLLGPCPTAMALEVTP